MAFERLEALALRIPYLDGLVLGSAHDSVPIDGDRMYNMTVAERLDALALRIPYLDGLVA